MQIEPKSLMPSPSKLPWILSILLLTIVIGSGGILFFYNRTIDSSISSIKTDITDKKWQITTIEANKDLVVKNILLANSIRPSIDVHGLVNEFRDAAFRSNVRLQWFNVQDDTISTTLISTVWDASIHPDPAATIIKMMREYDLGNKYFKLDPIISISGDSSRRVTGIQFHVSHDMLKN